MIIGDDKNRALDSILGSGPDGGLSKKPDESAPDESLHAIAEELIDAVHAKDAAGVVEALRALIAEIESEDDAEDESEESPE
jgi:hypothetical protein